MTKNKYLFIITTMLLAGLVSSCKPVIDVEGTCKDIATATIVGSDSIRSGAIMSGLTLKVVDYKFLPGNRAIRTETTFGDGVYKAPTSNTFSYAPVEYGKNNVGLKFLFTPYSMVTEGATAEAESFVVEFLNNAIIENEVDTLADQLAKVENFGKILTTFPNSTWEYQDTEYYIDITEYDSIDVQIIKTVTPTGIKRDTIYDTIRVEVKDTIGIHRRTSVEVSFTRDASTLQNLGHYKYDYVVLTKGDSITPGQPVDSLCIHKDFDMRWGFSSVTTARQFDLVAIAEDADKETLTFSMFKYTAGSSVIVNNSYTYTFKE